LDLKTKNRWLAGRQRQRLVLSSILDFWRYDHSPPPVHQSKQDFVNIPHQNLKSKGW